MNYFVAVGVKKMTVNPISIRMPSELKNWAEERSTRNFRSLSAEVVAILTSTRDDEYQNKSALCSREADTNE